MSNSQQACLSGYMGTRPMIIMKKMVIHRSMAVDRFSSIDEENDNDADSDRMYLNARLSAPVLVCMALRICAYG